MAMFFCAECQRLRDSDDGCEEAPASKYFPAHQLLCAACADEAEDERERAAVERGINEQRAWYDTSEELK